MMPTGDSSEDNGLETNSLYLERRRGGLKRVFRTIEIQDDKPQERRSRAGLTGGEEGEKVKLIS